MDPGPGPLNILPPILSLCYVASKYQGIATTSQHADLWMSNSARVWKSQENPRMSWKDPDPCELHSCLIIVLLDPYTLYIIATFAGGENLVFFSNSLPTKLPGNAPSQAGRHPVELRQSQRWNGVSSLVDQSVP